MAQRFKLAPPTRAGARSTRRFVDFPVLTGGEREDTSPKNLRQDQTPDLLNFELQGNYIRPRQALTRWSVGTLPDNAPMLGLLSQEESGLSFDLAWSDKTFYWSMNSLWAWGSYWSTVLSTGQFLSSSGITGSTQMSLNTSNPGELAHRPLLIPGYSGANEPIITVSSRVGSGITTDTGVSSKDTAFFSAIRWSKDSDGDDHGPIWAWRGPGTPDELYRFAAGFDAPAVGVVFNERGVYASASAVSNLVGNDAAIGKIVQNQIFWSAPGQPDDVFDTSSGAGSQILNELRGKITGMVTDQDRLLVFSNKQVWEASPRYDDFVFDFRVLSQEVGMPFPDCAVATPTGTFFLGPNFQPYVIQGTNVQPLARSLQRFLLKRYPEGASEVATFRSKFIPGDNVWVLGVRRDPSDGDTSLNNAFLYVYTDRLSEPQLPGGVPEVAWSEVVPASDGWSFTGITFSSSVTKSTRTDPVGGVPYTERTSSNSIGISHYRPVFSISSGDWPQTSSGFDIGDLNSDRSTTSAFSLRYRSPELLLSRDYNKFEMFSEAGLEFLPAEQASSVVSLRIRGISSDNSATLGGPFALSNDASNVNTRTQLFPTRPFTSRNPQVELEFSTLGSDVRLSRIQLGLRGFTGRGQRG